MFTCDLYAEVVPQMSPPPHDLERLRTTMVDFIVIFNSPGTQRRVVDFVRVGYFIPLNGPLNGHPPSIIVMKWTSTNSVLATSVSALTYNLKVHVSNMF